MINFANHFYILDEENVPVECDIFTWSRWLDDEQNRRIVDFTEITSETCVSTVFLGLDHRLCMLKFEGPPILFETMIFGGPLSGEMWRYSTWDDAEAGHKATVRKCRKAIGQKIDETQRRSSPQ